MMSIRPLDAGTAAEVAAYLFQKEHRYFAVAATFTEWYGSLAHRLGLSPGGSVREAEFLNLMEGYDPAGVHRLVPRARGKRYPGTDLTFSAPKSVSILLALDQEEVRLAHRLAVREALDFIERHLIRYRLHHGGRMAWRQARAALFAVFEHDVSRALDPQLHSHCILLNAAWDEEFGKYRAIRNDEIFRYQKACSVVYRSALARHLRAFGYAIRMTDPAEALFEVAGVPDDVRAAFSERRRRIEATVRRWKAEGRYPAAKAPALYELACLKSRPRKDEALGLLEIRSDVAETLAGLGYSREGLIHDVSYAQDAGLPDPLPPRAAVRRAVERLSERASFMTYPEILKTALTFSFASLRPEDVEAAVAEALREGELLMFRAGADPTALFTTPELIEMERAVAVHVLSGRDAAPPLLAPGTLAEAVSAARLAPDQAEALAFLGRAPHRWMGVVGYAGTGKSRLIHAFVQACRQEGLSCEVLAPTGKAAEELAALGLPARTVDAWLLSSDPAPAVLVVDEASMLGIRKLHALMEKAPDARVVLVGDPRQLRPVEAGTPFELLVAEGLLPVSRLDRIVRQTDPAFREAVYRAAEDPRRAVELLEALGAVRPRPEPAEVARLVYELGGPERVLVVTPTRARADELNAAVRAEARARGDLRGADVPFTAFRPLQDVLEVRQGDVLEAVRPTPGWRPGQARRVLARLGFEAVLDDGSVLDLRGRAGGFRAGRPVERPLAVGDRIVFTKNDRRLGVQNGLSGEVLDVSPAGVLVRTEGRNPKVISFNPKEFPYFDYGYASTTHKAQGRTVDAVVVDVPADRADARQFYVQVSRGRRSVVVLTDDPARLAERLGAAPRLERHVRQALRAGVAVPARLEALDRKGLLVEAPLEAGAVRDLARRVGTPTVLAPGALADRLRGAGLRVVSDPADVGGRPFVAVVPASADRRWLLAAGRARAVLTDDRPALRRAAAALPAPDPAGWVRFDEAVRTRRAEYAYARIRSGPHADAAAGPGRWGFGDWFRERVRVTWRPPVPSRAEAQRDLARAVRLGDLAGVRDALARGADPNEGQLLHKAVFMGRRDVVEALLQAGADPNRPGEAGGTPLHLASYRGDAELVRLLLQAGADPTAPDRSGLTPLDVARLRGFAYLDHAFLGRPPALPEAEAVSAAVPESARVETAGRRTPPAEIRRYRERELAEIRSADLIDWFIAQGVRPVWIDRSGTRALFHVPWRTDRNPSLSVFLGDDGEWHWEDKALREGGSMIDAAMRLWGTDYVETVRRLRQTLLLHSAQLPLSPSPPASSADRPDKRKTAGRIEFLADRGPAERYLESRGIPPDLLRRFGVEMACVRAYGRTWAAFPNEAGGWNCLNVDPQDPWRKMVIDRQGLSILRLPRPDRPPVFRRAAVPAMLDRQPPLVFAEFPTRRRVVVLEGIVDALSYLVLAQPPPDVVISLNSTANAGRFVEYARENLRGSELRLLLDNDRAGSEATERIMRELGAGFHVIDERARFFGHHMVKDVNDLLMAVREGRIIWSPPEDRFRFIPPIGGPPDDFSGGPPPITGGPPII